MARLKSTKAILRGSLETTHFLLARTDAQITQDYHALNRIKGSILRTKNEASFIRIKNRLEALAVEMGYPVPKNHEKEHLRRKVQVYKKQNSFLRYAATHQALINICVIYEDFIRRIILKYYEENIRRIPSSKETLKNKVIIDALVRGENMHRMLAEKVADDLMYGSIEFWHKTLIGFGMNGIQTPDELVEIFLLRNCFVHNNKKVSPQLHAHDPIKYQLRAPIHLTVTDIDKMQIEILKSFKLVCDEFNRAFPSNQGTWLSNS